VRRDGFGLTGAPRAQEAGTAAAPGKDEAAESLSEELRDTQETLSRTLKQNERLTAMVAALKKTAREGGAPTQRLVAAPAAAPAPPPAASAETGASEELEEAVRKHKDLLASIQALQQRLVPHAPRAAAGKAPAKVAHAAVTAAGAATHARAASPQQSAAHRAAAAALARAYAEHQALLSMVARLKHEVSESARARQQDLAQVPVAPEHAAAAAVAEVPKSAPQAALPKPQAALPKLQAALPKPQAALPKPQAAAAKHAATEHAAAKRAAAAAGSSAYGAELEVARLLAEAKRCGRWRAALACLLLFAAIGWLIRCARDWLADSLCSRLVG
jgi:hypothetical protein